jgi:polyhydroxyalkanoate synthesis regulator phasin
MAEKNQDDQMAELTERARLISQDASAKVTMAMRDMVGAAAGIAGFAVESARDLVQYMVRRGQMTKDEADKLIREAEVAYAKRPKAERDRLSAQKAAAAKAAADKKAARIAAETAAPVRLPSSPGRILAQGAGKSVKQLPAAKKEAAPEPVKPAQKPASKAPVKAGKPATKTAAKTIAKPPAKSAKAPAKKAPAKKAVKKKR